MSEYADGGEAAFVLEIMLRSRDYNMGTTSVRDRERFTERDEHDLTHVRLELDHFGLTEETLLAALRRARAQCAVTIDLDSWPN